MERLELELSIDHDYVAHVDLRSTMRRDHVKAEIFDLEFTLRFPSTADKATIPLSEDGVGGDLSPRDSVSVASNGTAGKVRLRSNVAAEPSWGKFRAIW